MILFTVAIFFPYSYIATAFSIQDYMLDKAAIFIVQLFSTYLAFLAFKRSKSRSFKLFWQYLLFALITVCISNLLFNDDDHKLFNDFITLFTYFFILLAVESNPHLSNVPESKFINGRMPSLFFALVSFSYFILLPAQFSPEVYASGKPAKVFDILICALITYRLVICLIDSKSTFWRGFYSALVISSFILTIENINALGAINNTPLIAKGYINQLLLLLPYFFLAISSCIALNNKRTIPVTEKSNIPELYILLLLILPASFHLYGIEQAQFFIINSRLQSVVVLSWACVCAVLMTISLLNKRSKSHHQQRSLMRIQQQIDDLKNTNDSLKNAMLNSESIAIVNASNNAILTTSINGEILSANPAAVQMFQSLEHELKGTSVNQLFAPKDEMHFFFDYQSNVYSLQRKELGISVECMSLRSDGTEFPAQAELQWAERADKPLIVLTFINLSARKLAEKQALESKDKFIANISHEFRTPLTIINGIIDKHIAQAIDDREKDDLTTAKRNGLRLVRMVEQLLELSRITDNPQLSLNTYRLKSLMTMPVDSFCQLALQSKLTFSSNIPDNLWLECDAQAFEKIIFNLLANAIKYTPKGGIVQVNAYAEQETIIIDIIDSGIGISKSSQDTIFERFQRADDVENQATFGVGIGLSLVNELVKAHNWRITLVSEYGHGSKFSLSLPIASALDTEHQLAVSLSENEVSSLLIEQHSTKQEIEKDHQQQVVLVIEDNLDMQSHIKQVIEQQHHCILAGSGEHGLTLAQEYIPDLIVCDLMLTGIDGFEVLTELKNNDITAHIPVILLTARSDLESRLQGLNLNADEYLSKPFNQNELLIRIQNLINNRIQLQGRYLAQFTEEQKAEKHFACQENANRLSTSDSNQLNAEEKFLTKLENLIAKHYAEQELDITFLANNLAMSERQLQRKIKVILGTTPNNFIKEFRIKKAKQMLSNGSQIGRIALDVGFSSQTYFGRCFKEITGQTPKQFQQEITK